MSRDLTLAGAIPQRRRLEAEREAARFATFCSAFGLDEGVEAVSLYLAAQADVETGQATRRRLHYLDLVRRISGQPPWSTSPDVRALLHGLHRARPIGPQAPDHVDPLYVELVHALVDATFLSSVHQRRAAAAIILHASTGLPAAVLTRLTWDQVRLTRRQVVVTVSQRVGRGAPAQRFWTLQALPDDPACPVASLLLLRGGRYVLVDKPALWDEARLRGSLDPYLRNSDTEGAVGLALLEVSQGSQSQVRDRALLTLGYAAALRTHEATHLRRRDVSVREGGLTLQVAGRRSEVTVPSVANPRYDPVRAWLAWVALMDAQGLSALEAPAFPTCNYSVIEARALAAQGLNRVIHTRCAEAGLRGRFAWTSLRIGMMRMSTTVEN
ncbi:hypothetical protein ACNKF0_00110 [Nocardioides sp. T5]|uniref:hypothetical protein n=1 Tax=Nocardioides sp. T5 TaxID=3400182 RepID=UPI003A875943